ncbi:protein FAM180A isoform X1 [Mustelus asterias]
MPMMWMAVRVAWCLLTCLSFSVTPCTAHRLRNGEDLSWGDQSEQPIVFHHDISDTFLMYEFLAGGLTIDEKNIVTLNDEELSSMRSAKVFHSIMNTRIPKTPDSIQKRLNDLPSSGETFEMDTFEQLLLASVYTAHRAWQSDLTERQAWGNLFCQLLAAVTHDLSGKVVTC